VPFFVPINELVYLSITHPGGNDQVLYGFKPASLPGSGSTCNGIFTGVFSGNVTVTPGQSCTFISGGIAGNVTVLGGHFEVDNASVQGTLQIQGNSVFLIRSATVNGSLLIHNLVGQPAAAWPPSNLVCGSNILGSMEFQNNLVPIQVGGSLQGVGPFEAADRDFVGFGAPPCGANTITGDVEVLANQDSVNADNAADILQGIALSQNTITGDVTFNGNAGPSEVVNNHIAGDLMVLNTSDSSGLVYVNGNHVGGSLHVYGNSAGEIQTEGGIVSTPIQIFSNVVTGELIALNNTAAEVSTNTVSGNLIVDGNSIIPNCPDCDTAAAEVRSNVVSGNITVSNNLTGSTDVSANTATGSLQCDGNLAITTNNGANSAAQLLDQCAPTPQSSNIPSLTQLSPTNALVGGAAFALNVSGQNFGPHSMVLWNGSARTTMYVNSTLLKAAILKTDLTDAGTVTIFVMTPGPGGGTSAAVSFTVSNPVPALRSVAPLKVTVSTASSSLTVNGSGFVNGSVVEWNGNPLETMYVSNMRLTAVITSGDVTAAGIATVAVVNPAPGGGTSAPRTVTIKNPVPKLSALSPQNIPAYSASFTLTVTGSNFVNGSAIAWKGNRLVTTYVSSTQLTALVPNTNLTTVGLDMIKVINPMPGGGNSNPASFRVTNPIPVAASVSPSMANAGGAAFTLLVTGSDFVKGSKVLWNGSQLMTIFINSTLIKAKVPALDIHTRGTAQIAVSNPTPGGGQSGTISFTIQ
jgi:hypothetical protein